MVVDADSITYETFKKTANTHDMYMELIEDVSNQFISKLEIIKAHFLLQNFQIVDK